ncbi:MAG: cyclohydrolase [Bradyrhizobium sp.]|nr:cyclohydrolase [Bradyrhizobium sp.]
MTKRYREYIRSHRWLASAARLGELAASGFRCRTCNAGRSEAVLHVHHRTYVRLGAERQDDLTTLCVECHVAITDSIRRRRYAGLTIVYADVKPAIDVSVPLFDPKHSGVLS